MFFRKWMVPLFFLSPAIALAFTLTTANMRGWDKEEVRFRFNPANCGDNVGRVESAIRKSVDLWNAVPTSRLRISYGGQTAESGLSAEPIIACVVSGLTGAVGVANISVTTADGIILNGDIQLNMEPGAAGNISTVTDGQLDVTLAHEMGHIFGLGHSQAPSALMYYSIVYKQTLNLSQDDIDGLTWLYGRKEPGDGFMGCGSLGEGGGPGGPLLWVLAFAGLFTLLLRQRDFRPREAV